jgi:solute carrier family 8 (sodium/calcium exchanger)
MIRTE